MSTLCLNSLMQGTKKCYLSAYAQALNKPQFYCSPDCCVIIQIFQKVLLATNYAQTLKKSGLILLNHKILPTVFSYKLQNLNPVQL